MSLVRRLLRIVSCVTLLLCFPIGTPHAQHLRLVTDHQPPYVVIDASGNIGGTVTDLVRKVLDTMGVPYEIKAYPWKRAQIMVQRGEADGFFAASQSEKRDLSLTFSTPLAAQRWVWALSKDCPLEPGTALFHAEAHVSSFKGANMQAWLEANGFRTTLVPPVDYHSLISLLLAGRIDAALGGHLGITHELEARGLTAHFRIVPQRDKPVGVYFNRDYLTRNPDFMSTFNDTALTILEAREGGLPTDADEIP